MKLTFLRRLCAVVIGITFLISGLAKIIDPVGTMLIVKEYFKLLNFGFLNPAAKVLGVILATTEAITGLALISGVLRKSAAIITYALLGVFTPITLFLLIKNPSMDCGCFGEAIHLNHLQSFLKNLALLALALIAFIPLKTIGKPKARKWVSFSITALSVLYAVLYSNTHIPIADFTEFNFGAELMAASEDDEDLVEHHPVLSFRNAEGEYLDDEAAQGKVVIFSVYNPADANWDRIHRQFLEVTDAGARPMLLVASYPAEIDSFGIPIDMPVYYADYKTLITLNRSNGGATYLCEGEIIGKWHERNFPAIAKVLNADEVEYSSTLILTRRIKSQGFCLALAAILILI